MKHKMLAAVLAAGLITPPIQALAAPQNQALQVTESPSSYVLTVADSRLTMSIPKGNLQRPASEVRGSADSARYFFFRDPAQGLVITGLFEPADAFPGLSAFWKETTKTWRQQGDPEPKDVKMEKIGRWQTILYGYEMVDQTNTHIRAHYVDAGTWIDIHLSLTSNKSPADARETLIKTLKAITVKVRKR